jgi:F1F0 ATPase subunit 2
MNMWDLLVSMAVGIGLGAFFYGGLWLTVRRLAVARFPALLAMGSLIFRTAAVLAVLILSSRGRWQNAVAVLAGMVAGRIAVSRYLSHARNT